MTMKMRVLGLTAVLAVSAVLAGCGHYNCGTTFGSASCNAGQPGLGGGPGNNNIGVTSYVYFMDDASPQMSVEGLNINDSQNFAPDSSWVSPVFPVSLAGTADGGIVIVS